MSDYLPLPIEASAGALLEQLDRKKEQIYELVCLVLQLPEVGSLDLREFATGGARRWFIEKLQSLLNGPHSSPQMLLAERLLAMLSCDDEQGAFFAGLVKTSLNSPHLDRWLPEIVRWGHHLKGAGREVRDLLIGLTLRRLLSQPNTGSYALLTQAAEAVPLNEDTFALDALLKLASQFVQTRQKATDEGHVRQDEVDSLRSKLQETRNAYKELEREIIRSRREAEDGVLKSIFGALSPALTQIPSMRAAKRAGKRLKVDDLLTRFDLLERALRDQGFEPVGEVGHVLPFDPHCHTLLDQNVDVAAGDAVQVRFVGYQFRGQVLCRAQVSRQ